MEDSAKLQLLLDRSEIIDVMNRHALGIDRQLWDMYGSCFADNLRYKSSKTGGWMVLRREEMMSAVSKLFAQFDATQHFSANHVITVNDQEATCVSALNATHFKADAPGGCSQRVIGYYDAHLVRQDTWRIDQVELVVLWEDGNQDIIETAYANINITELAGSHRA